MFRRTTGGRWELGEAVAGGRIVLESIGVELAVDEVYASAGVRDLDVGPVATRIG